MKKVTKAQTKELKGGWTCWFPGCKKKGTKPGDGLRHMQLNPLHWCSI